MIRLISVKCPDCGAALQIEEGRTTAFCSYCGARILLHNENEYIYRSVDEAEIKQAENDRIYMMKELEIDEKNEEHHRLITYIWLAFTILLCIAGFICAGSDSNNIKTTGEVMLFADLMVGIYGAVILLEAGKKNRNRNRPGYAKVPEHLTDITSMQYITVQAALQSAGFSNIQTINLGDLMLGIFRKKGCVESVTIGGESLSPGEWQPQDAPVVITYHGFPEWQGFR